jgi:hypothetical protein
MPKQKTLLISILSLSFLVVAGSAFAALTFNSTAITSDGALTLNPTGQPVTVNGDFTVTGTCTGCGGGGGFNSQGLFNTQLPNIDGSTLPAPVLAGAGAGNLSNGVYSYKFTQLDNSGHETAVGTATANVTVVSASSNGKITVSLPTRCGYSPIINVYRTHANGSSYFLQSQQNYTCASSFTDNTADSSLTTAAPNTNTTSLDWQFNGSQLIPPDDTVSNGKATLVVGTPTLNGFYLVGADPPVNIDAGNWTISATSGYGTGNGGELDIYGGGANGSSGNGGPTTIWGGGTIGGSSGNAGSLSLHGGISNGSGAGGDANVIAGISSAGTGGDTTIRPGSGGVASGVVHIQAGDANDRLGINAMGALFLGCHGGVCTPEPIVWQGNIPSVASVGTNSCGTVANMTGGSNDYVGDFTETGGGTQCRLTFTATALNRRNCSAVDETAHLALGTVYVDATHSDIYGSLGGVDHISYQCSTR